MHSVLHLSELEEMDYEAAAAAATADVDGTLEESAASGAPLADPILIPDEGPVSNHEQFLFHLRTIRQEQEQHAHDQGRLGSDSPTAALFPSFPALLAAVRAEHQISLKRRVVIRQYLVEEADLFDVRLLLHSPVSAAAAESLMPVSDAGAASILSDASLALLYFRCVSSSGGTRLLHHVKQVLRGQIPQPSSHFVPDPTPLLYTGSDGADRALRPANHGLNLGADIRALIAQVDRYDAQFPHARGLHCAVRGSAGGM